MQSTLLYLINGKQTCEKETTYPCADIVVAFRKLNNVIVQPTRFIPGSLITYGCRSKRGFL